jgi:MFS family permease
MSAPGRLFTPRFIVMCGFNFVVFLSAFQLLPTAPFQIRALGGSALAAGLFLGYLTYSSALSGPITGGIVDRVGKRRVLMTSSLALATFSAIYAVLPSYRAMLALVVVHGVFWSGLLVAAGSYVTDLVPPLRRAEGMSYWGMSTIFAVAMAPTIGLWVFEHGGWTLLCIEAAGLNLLMFAIAWLLLPSDPAAAPAEARAWSWRGLVEWKVLALSFTLFLYAYRRVLLPCLVLVMLGFVLLAVGGSRILFVISALVFGTGFGAAYPLFLGHVMRHVDPARRGAAFGSILAAFDTGIGTGSIAIGWIVQHHGFQAAYGTAALVAAFAVPYFLTVESRVLPADTPVHA